MQTLAHLPRLRTLERLDPQTAVHRWYRKRPRREAGDVLHAHEDGAQQAWRSLVGRLRYRDYLGVVGYTKERQKNGTLHYHGIAHLPWFDDGLAEWRELIIKSGFGQINRLEIAQKTSAGYCAKYIAKGLAEVAPLRRAYGFSADFPRARALVERETLAEQLGVKLDSDCEWTATYLLSRHLGS
jgi:hypothetical protein